MIDFLCELGDMKSGKLETAKRGGHLFLSELKLQTHQLEKLEMFDDGYFTCNVKHFEDLHGKSDPKTFFPYGATPLESVEIIIDAIKNPIEIGLVSRNEKTITLSVENQKNQKFIISITHKNVTFFRKG